MFWKASWRTRVRGYILLFAFLLQHRHTLMVTFVAQTNNLVNSHKALCIDFKRAFNTLPEINRSKCRRPLHVSLHKSFCLSFQPSLNKARPTPLLEQVDLRGIEIEGQMGFWSLRNRSMKPVKWYQRVKRGNVELIL